MPDMSPLFYLAMGAIFAFVGLMLVPVFALLAWFIPPLWPWIFAPVPVGLLVGLLWARLME